MSRSSSLLPDGFLERCGDIVGTDRVLLEPDARAPYEVDFWRHIDGVAAAVVRPRTTAEVAALVALAGAQGVAIVPQGGNTGLVGGGIPDHSGRQVVLSLAGLDRVRAVDPRGEWLVAEAGCTLAAVQAAAEAAGRLFPLSLGSEGTCQIGGNLSSNAGGVNVIRYGMAREMVLGLEVVLADGRVWQVEAIAQPQDQRGAAEDDEHPAERRGRRRRRFAGARAAEHGREQDEDRDHDGGDAGVAPQPAPGPLVGSHLVTVGR